MTIKYFKRLKVLLAGLLILHASMMIPWAYFIIKRMHFPRAYQHTFQNIYFPILGIVKWLFSSDTLYGHPWFFFSSVLIFGGVYCVLMSAILRAVYDLGQAVTARHPKGSFNVIWYLYKIIFVLLGLSMVTTHMFHADATLLNVSGMLLVYAVVRMGKNTRSLSNFTILFIIAYLITDMVFLHIFFGIDFDGIYLKRVHWSGNLEFFTYCIFIPFTIYTGYLFYRMKGNARHGYTS